MEYFDKSLQTHWYWQDLAQGIAKWHLSSVEALPSAKFWKSERPYLLNWVKYFDKLLRKHWYWQHLAQEIAKWHFSMVEALLSSKFWKSDNGAISWTEWNIDTVILTRCTPWDCQMAFEFGRFFAEVQILKKGETVEKWHLSSVEALPSAKFWKSEKCIISWIERNILIDFCVNIDIEKIQPKRLWNVIVHLSRFSRAPNSEKVKMNLSLEVSGILWWNFAYTLVLTRCGPWDCQMTFGVGRGFAEVQILKKSYLTLKPFRTFW